MPDAHEALGQNMQQEPPDEFDRIEGDRFSRLAFPVFNRERHPSEKLMMR